MSKKSKRILALLNEPRHRQWLLDALHQSMLDEGAVPLGGDKGEKFLSELNEMAEMESKAGRKGPGG